MGNASIMLSSSSSCQAAEATLAFCEAMQPFHALHATGITHSNAVLRARRHILFLWRLVLHLVQVISPLLIQRHVLPPRSHFLQV